MKFIEMDDENAQHQDDQKPLKKEDFLSFKALGRPISLDGVVDELQVMKGDLGENPTPEVARSICEKSGSHLIKLVSSRVDGDHATLRFDDTASNRRSSILPSVNAADIPFCKVVFRPLEVTGYPAMSIIDHILNPEGHSGQVLGAFANVFGENVLCAMKEVLLSPPSVPRKLGVGEFPIIFVPRPGGNDLQITPVSPVTTFMGMKRVTDPYPERAVKPRPSGRGYKAQPR